MQFVRQFGIAISMSRKACPWENGYQEAFYSQFKLEMGDTTRFSTLGELAEAIALAMAASDYLRWGS